MTPTRLLIGQIIVVFAIVIAELWFATEWAAWKLAWQPELGLPWFFIGHWPVYRPWSIFPRWYHFDAYAPRIFSSAGAMAGASGFIGCGAAIAGSLLRARQPLQPAHIEHRAVAGRSTQPPHPASKPKHRREA